jgi:hypothetical protein
MRAQVAPADDDGHHVRPLQEHLLADGAYEPARHAARAETEKGNAMTKPIKVILIALGAVTVLSCGFIGAMALLTGTLPAASPSRRASAAPLKFFIRPELGGLRVTNDGDDVQTDCEVMIAGQYRVLNQTFHAHSAEILSYYSFLTPHSGYRLDESEGFSRARSGGVTIRCGAQEASYR